MSEDKDEDELTISVPQAAKLAGMSTNSGYAAVARGEIPAVRFGRLLRVPKRKFLAMLNGEG